MDRGPPVSTSAVLHLKHVNVNLHAPDNRKSINHDGGAETPKFWFRYFTKDEWIFTGHLLLKQFISNVLSHQGTLII